MKFPKKEGGADSEEEKGSVSITTQASLIAEALKFNYSHQTLYAQIMSVARKIYLIYVSESLG